MPEYFDLPGTNQKLYLLSDKIFVRGVELIIRQSAEQNIEDSIVCFVPLRMGKSVVADQLNLERLNFFSHWLVMQYSLHKDPRTTEIFVVHLTNENLSPHTIIEVRIEAGKASVIVPNPNLEHNKLAAKVLVKNVV